MKIKTSTTSKHKKLYPDRGYPPKEYFLLSYRSMNERAEKMKARMEEVAKKKCTP